jgi:hypothetical protein
MLIWPQTGRRTGAADALTDERCGKWRLPWLVRWHSTGPAAISPTSAGIHMAITFTVSDPIPRVAR